LIPNNVRTGTTTSTMEPIESIDMTLDQESIPHIMKLLTGQYGDNEMACIREYSTNALDSHFDAGVTRPIEVETPSALSPFLTIEDFGVGLSRDDIRAMYSKYGKSSKREQRETNGSMGIGAKAALAYASQFTLVGTKDGVRVTVVIGRKDDGSGKMDIIDQTATDEPNGVKIMIPAKDNHNFESKAQRFFQFWKSGTVLLNGTDPSKTFARLTDRIFFYEGERDVVVMGNVAYPLQGAKDISDGSSKAVVCYVTMNGADEVVFTPSRESLVYDPITTNSIAGLEEEYNEAILKFIQDEIDGQKNHRKALKRALELREQFGRKFLPSKFTYKGEECNTYANFVYDEARDGKVVKVTRRYVEFRPSRSRNAVSRETNGYSIENMLQKTLIIVGYNKHSISADHKLRIRTYMDAKGMNRHMWSSVVMLLPEAAIDWDNFAASITHVKWSDVMAATKVTAARNVTERDGSYDVLQKGDGWYQEEDIESTDNIHYYLSGDYGKHGIGPGALNDLFKYEPDAKVVCIRTTQEAKLKRLYPNAKVLNTVPYAKRVANEVWDAMTKEQIEAIRIRKVYPTFTYSYNDKFGTEQRIPERYLDMLDDKEYAGVMRSLYFVTVPDFASHYCDGYTAAMKNLPKKVNFKSRYPLMNWEKHPAETVEYINSLYNNKEN